MGEKVRRNSVSKTEFRMFQHIAHSNGLTICHTSETVQSTVSEGVLIGRYINKMGTNGGGGEVHGRDGDDCNPFWSRVEIPTRMQIFLSLIFV